MDKKRRKQRLSLFGQESQWLKHQRASRESDAILALGEQESFVASKTALEILHIFHSCVAIVQLKVIHAVRPTKRCC
jgi:hypothetical protein